MFCCLTEFSFPSSLYIHSAKIHCFNVKDQRIKLPLPIISTISLDNHRYSFKSIAKKRNNIRNISYQDQIQHFNHSTASHVKNMWLRKFVCFNIIREIHVWEYILLFDISHLMYTYLSFLWTIAPRSMRHIDGEL